MRILRVLAQRHPAALTEAQWATLAGMKRTGGTWMTYKSRLRTAGLIVQSGGLWLCSEAGLERAGGAPEEPQTGADLIAMWQRAVGGGAARMLQALVDNPDGMSRSALAEALGMAANGGTFGTYLSRLRSNELLVVHGGQIALSEILRDAAIDARKEFGGG